MQEYDQAGILPTDLYLDLDLEWSISNNFDPGSTYTRAEDSYTYGLSAFEALVGPVIKWI